MQKRHHCPAELSRPPQPRDLQMCRLQIPSLAARMLPAVDHGLWGSAPLEGDPSISSGLNAKEQPCLASNTVMLNPHAQGKRLKLEWTLWQDFHSS